MTGSRSRNARPGQGRLAIECHRAASGCVSWSADPIRRTPPLHSRRARRADRQNLAFINWTVLTGLALGAYAVALLTRWQTFATRGFVRLTTICALLFGVLAWLSDGSLPATLGDSPVIADPSFDAPRRAPWPRSSWGSLDLFVLRPPVGRSRGSLRWRRGCSCWCSGRCRGAAARRAAPVPAGLALGGDRRRLRGDDPGPLVSRDAKAAEAPLVLVSRLLLGDRRRAGRPLRVLDRHRRGTGGGGAVCRAERFVAFFVWMRLIWAWSSR